MKEKKELYDQAIKLAENCNTVLKDDPQLLNINKRLELLARDLNNIVVAEITGIKLPNIEDEVK